MGTIAWFVLWLIGLGTLAYFQIPLLKSTIIIAAGLITTTFFSSWPWYLILLAWAIAAPVLVVLNHAPYRRKYVISPILEIFRQSVPTMSRTEQEALDAGTVGWDGELFSGRPDWKKLTRMPVPELSAEEQAFLNGPTRTLCEMLDEWDACERLHDLPEAVWDYLKKEGFFALIIPKQYGGKGFSALAHSKVIEKLASRSFLLSSITSVPNSLGPAELLLHYGTQKQKDYYLPRLAQGTEIPCFALTAPNAGSDAGSITDTGIICKQNIEGKETLCIRLNWNKRYITLAPIATLLGLAFKLHDPEHLIGEEDDLGITCALVPTHLPGITIGRRHMPSNIPFQNGPTQGQDVIIPISSIIGGQEMAGQGWRMLVECLSAGRAISLPSTSVGGQKTAVFASSAYSIIRQQFNTQIASFEGIQEALVRMCGFTYISDATTKLTVNAIDQGENPAVPGAIAKYHVTELGRRCANDAMDVHGGKGIMLGPNNYLARAYQSIPIAITVEGANILTRSLIIFGQGAIRCHPFILKEMEAAKQDDIQVFDQLLMQHAGHLLRNKIRALFHGLTFARFAHSPTHSIEAKYYRQWARSSAAFAFVADNTMMLLGGKLKFKESLSGRLGDCLSMMYMGTAILKQYADQGKPVESYPLVEWSSQWCLHEFWKTMEAVLSNFPNKWVGLMLKMVIMPFGAPAKAPSDKLMHKVVKLMTTDSLTRNTLVDNIFISENENDQIHLLELAFKENLNVLPIRKRLLEAVKSKTLESGNIESLIEAAVRAKILTPEEATKISYAESLNKKIVAVDDFDPDSLKPPYKPAGVLGSGSKDSASSIVGESKR